MLVAGWILVNKVGNDGWIVVAISASRMMKRQDDVFTYLIVVTGTP